VAIRECLCFIRHIRHFCRWSISGTLMDRHRHITVTSAKLRESPQPFFAWIPPSSSLRSRLQPLHNTARSSKSGDTKKEQVYWNEAQLLSSLMFTIPPGKRQPTQCCSLLKY